MAEPSYPEAILKAFEYLGVPFVISLAVGLISMALFYDGGPLTSATQVLVVVVPFAVLAYLGAAWKFVVDAVHYGVSDESVFEQVD